MFDFDITNHGSIWAFVPLTEAADEWWSDNVGDDGGLMLGNAYAVEHRYAPDILEGLLADGLTAH